MKPAAVLSVTDRYRLKEMTLERSGAMPPGRVMWCNGRKVLGYGNVADLPKVFEIPRGANTLCLSMEDYDDVREWLA